MLRLCPNCQWEMEFRNGRCVECDYEDEEEREFFDEDEEEDTEEDYLYSYGLAKRGRRRKR